MRRAGEYDGFAWFTVAVTGTPCRVERAAHWRRRIGEWCARAVDPPNLRWVVGRVAGRETLRVVIDHCAQLCRDPYSHGTARSLLACPSRRLRYLSFADMNRSSLSTRRHHCRMCGQVCCGDCSGRRHPKYPETRICTPCYSMIMVRVVPCTYALHCEDLLFPLVFFGALGHTPRAPASSALC